MSDNSPVDLLLNNPDAIPESVDKDAKLPADVAPLYSHEANWKTGRRDVRFVRESDQASIMKHRLAIGEGKVRVIPDDCMDGDHFFAEQKRVQDEMFAVYKKEMKRLEDEEDAKRRAEAERKANDIKAKTEREIAALRARQGIR